MAELKKQFAAKSFASSPVAPSPRHENARRAMNSQGVIALERRSIVSEPAGRRSKRLSSLSQFACFSFGACVAGTLLYASGMFPGVSGTGASGIIDPRAYLSVPAQNLLARALSTDSNQIQDPSKVLVPRENVERTVEAYTALLAKELEKVQAYEEKLRKRSAALEALLNDTLELDPSPAKDQISATGKQTLGMGGNDGPSTPFISVPREGKAKKVSPKPEVPSHKFLNDFDELLAQLDQLPIGTPVQGALSSGFGWRRSPFSRSRRSHLHEGLDIAVDYNSEVLATADGVVRTAGYSGAYGETIVLDHGNGYETLYGHMSKLSVTVGQHVCRGQQIGLVGSTGRSTGPHVHYEVRRNGRPKNPEPYVSLANLLKLL